MAADQALTLEMFLGLREMRRDWSGALLLGVGLNEAGRALALASLAAGAAGLFLEQDSVELRKARREGCCTFSVNTLEEAVRALKNEVRQGRAVTLALSGDSAAWLEGMVVRGLQPDALAFAATPTPAEAVHAATLELRGLTVLHGVGLAAWPDATDLQAGLRNAVIEGAEIRTDFALTLADRRQRDQALTASRGKNGPNARWLRVAPSLFPRALQRVYLHPKP